MVRCGPGRSHNPTLEPARTAMPSSNTETGAETYRIITRSPVPRLTR
jgi:hypothetical protein